MHQLHVTASAYKKTHFAMKIQTDSNFGSVIGHVLVCSATDTKDIDTLADYPESPVGIYFISVKGQISLFSPV